MSSTDQQDPVADRGRAIFESLRAAESDEEELAEAAAPAAPPAAEQPVAPAPSPTDATDDLPRDGLPRVIAIANQKGGVGKTTTAVNLGACLADLGYRVLVVDLDPQGNASTGLGINVRELETSMYDVILHDAPMEDCLEGTAIRNLLVAPSALDLAGAEIELVPAFSREMRLRNAIEQVRDDFDYVLIDCPPSLGLLTVNAMAAAEEVLVPIQCEYYALEGLGQLIRNVALVQKNLNRHLRGVDHRAGDVRRPDQAGRPGGRRGAGALRREGLPTGDPPHGAPLGGSVVRAADHRLRSLLPGGHRLPGAGQGGQPWPGVAVSDGVSTP